MQIFRVAQNNVVSSNYLTSEVESLHHTYDDILEGNVLARIQQYDFWKLVTYNIDNLDLEEWPVDNHLVQKYVKTIKNNPNYPPVIIDNKSYGYPTIVDGTHRLNALHLLGYDTVQAYVPYVQRKTRNRL